MHENLPEVEILTTRVLCSSNLRVGSDSLGLAKDFAVCKDFVNVYVDDAARKTITLGNKQLIAACQASPELRQRLLEVAGGHATYSGTKIEQAQENVRSAMAEVKRLENALRWTQASLEHKESQVQLLRAALKRHTEQPAGCDTQPDPKMQPASTKLFLEKLSRSLAAAGKPTEGLSVEITETPNQFRVCLKDNLALYLFASTLTELNNSVELFASSVKVRTKPEPPKEYAPFEFLGVPR